MLNFRDPLCRSQLLSLCALLLVNGCAPKRPAHSTPLSTALHRVVRCLNPERGPVDIKRDQDLVVLVHGCNSSIAKFRNLAEVFQSRGQQAVCFTYDDRDSLISVANELNVALTALSPDLGSGKVTVIGHSQGGLIARYAASSADQVPIDLDRLVTVSTPFAGIRSARDCGSLPLQIFSFGITVGICQAVAGRKWTEIHDRAPFIVTPPPLPREVERHLAVMTDERGSCRRYEASKCVESDYVFSLDEQSVRNLVDPQIETKVVRSGHTAIVGEEQIVPVALIDLLEREKVLNLPAPTTLETRRQQLEQIYGPSKGSVSQLGVLRSHPLE